VSSGSSAFIAFFPEQAFAVAEPFMARIVRSIQ
jgi:hypothetical protein